MCDCDSLNLLFSIYEQRVSSQKKNEQSSVFKELRKSEVDIIIAYINLWPQRQCMCCYRDLKNFERFNLVINSLICLVVSKLKNIKALILAANEKKDEEKISPIDSSSKSEQDTTAVVTKQEDKQEKSEDAKLVADTTESTITPVTSDETEAHEEVWVLPELEKVLIFISKIYLLNFPLYVAYKHGIHGRIDDISQQEAQTLSMFCDIHETEIPVYLYRNVTLFCSSGGFGAIMQCFELHNLPVSTAHACTVAISNIKLWLNYRSIVQLFVPLRIKVLQYMCKLSDQDLRSPATKSMADFMWTTIKDPLDTQVSFDTEGLALAFKYFTSSTLTMRLAGLSQINAHINLFNDICTTETVGEVEVVGRKLADWLTDNHQLITHLFGPNLHVEVIKQSHIVLNFLAVENQITEEHITLMWQAAQLKHCSKPIYDILPSLVKNLAPKPAAHLYSLLCRLDPKEHTEQSIYIVSALTKLIWVRDRNRQGNSDLSGVNLSREIAEIPSSSENSVSVDGTNSDEEHPDEDSSDCRKSPIDVDGSDGAPPRKQARHIALNNKVCFVDNGSAKQYETEKDMYPILGRHIAAFNENTSSDECMEENEEAMRKKFRKKRKKLGFSRNEMQEMVESVSDGDSQSDPLFGGSDCSESHMREEVLERLNKDDTFFRAISDNQIMEFLHATENEGNCSSPMSNKSEKNMADFDDEDSPCEEELAQLASAQCLPQNRDFGLSIQARSRTGVITPHKNAKSKTNSGESSNEKSKSSVSSPLRSPDICLPGSTLLWDLLQDDKIGHLAESLALETEKALGTLLCFHTDKIVRKRFIEACLSNLANNKSVIVSLRLIPKLLASFQQFRDIGTHQVTMWADRNHKMMYHFFNNLKCYSNFIKAQRQNPSGNVSEHLLLVLNQNGDPLYSHITQIQVRLQFLSSIFCDIGSPKSFKLMINQIDVLWSCLANDPECADCLFAWLQTQAKAGAQHALGSNALQHIYLKKLPDLRPENISMVALTLFQQLFIMGLSEQICSENVDIIGMDNLWKIALRANDTEVSMAAIQYINTYYMEHQLKNEDEFVFQCMNYLTQAAEGLNSPAIEDQSIMCVQRALMLLNTHLETFRRRYAYHLRRWALDGKGIGSHSALRSEGPGPPIKIYLQPGGLPDKSVLHLYQTDLIAELKAEIAKWWETMQGSVKTNNSGQTAPVLGHLLSDGPLRIITQGQEITSEYDERSLIDVGFKDNQMVYVSQGGRGGRRRDHSTEHPSMLPAPSKDRLPTVLLLQSPYFEQLFKLMQTLGDMKMVRKGGNLQHTQAQVLSRRVWDILAMLPTSPTLLETFKQLSFDNEKLPADASQVSAANLCPTKKTVHTIKEVLDPSNLQKFMYSLHIVESLCKSKFAAAANKSAKNNQAKAKATKISKEKAVTSKKVTKESGAEPNESKDEQPDGNSNTDNEAIAKVSSTANSSGDSCVMLVDCTDQNGSEKETDPEGGCSSSSSSTLNVKQALDWSDQFIKNGGLKHLLQILLSGKLQRIDDDDFNEWRHDCLCSLLRILCLLGVEDLKQEENVIVIPKLNQDTLQLMDVKQTISRISSILDEASIPLKANHYKTGFWGRSQVVNFSMNLLVCFAYSSVEAREALWKGHYCWLQKLILDDPDPHVRRESCAALYRLCMGNSQTYSELMIPLLVKLISFLPIAEKMKTQSYGFAISEDGKEPYGQACRDYFWLLGRLVDNTSPELLKENISELQNPSIDIEALCVQVSKCVIERDYLEARHGNTVQDDGLVGLLNLMANLVKYDPPFKFSAEGQQFIAKIFECLFALPTPEDRILPKCKSQGARAASYDLLIEMCRNSPKNYLLLHSMLILQHRPGPHSPYPWDYWPRDDGRSECGYVGLTNLGATCYMASCIQHIFMMPQAREAILTVVAEAGTKHRTTLNELQRMFAYLTESERKSYNPRSFCRVYQMDHQPLNTGEQKDMAEFFIDLVSKLEEMTPELKAMVKRIFCGVISNNVVSLDCGHVSRTLEEFYTVRCQVADMRNLQESLDEVTVKDTLEGDNMYTCSQCGRKVRAEKRACFKKLPQILCFNTMRYTFNMVTMLKEKVNTHFSFPLRLDMSRYVEKTLMPQHYQEEKFKSQMRRKVSECDSNNANVSTDKGTGETMNIDDADKKVEPPRPKTQKEIDEEEQIKQEQLNMDEEESEDFNENYEYDLVGVTVHTGTADGGHYYSFIKERHSGGTTNDRWYLFNDAEVKIFDPSQIAAECFGGEMTSKTYDSVTEKYLDFSFEKTNSAYMLFYEWRSNKGGNEQRDQFSKSPTSSNGSQSFSPELKTFPEPTKPSCSKDVLLQPQPQTVEIVRPDVSSTASDKSKPTNPETEINLTLNATIGIDKPASDARSKNDDCDIVSKLIPSHASDTSPVLNGEPISKKGTKNTRKSLLNKELEKWIWEDNRHYLEDRNIFEHTYFNFMWQICGHIPQTLMILPDITSIAAQLSVSFFIETFIHAKEKPTMVLWVELLTKQFNASQDACEWFLRHMSLEPWWPVQVLIQCPNQMVRQMFQRLVIHVIQRLRQSHSALYLVSEKDDDGNEIIGDKSCVTKFIKSLILLMEHGAKAHLRHLSEFFGLLYEFSRQGDEETNFLLRINVIKSVADFYLGHKNQDCIDTTSDNDDNSSDETLSVDKTRPASLDKMIALVASLVERSRGSDCLLRLSTRDYNAIAGGKGFPFLYQQIKDNINPHQTRHLIHALCRYDDRLATQIIAMLFSALTKHTELCGPFFKLLTLLTENTAAGPSGLPCFSQLVLQRVWDAAEYCPQSSLEWLAVQAPRNKMIHAWILQSAESWVEQFLLAHNNLRVRNAAANLIVSLVPSQSFRSNYRATHHKLVVNSQRELAGEAQAILHTVLNILLRLLRSARNYAEINVHGTAKLTSYFTLMTYCMITKTEKLMLAQHIRPLWDLFHPKLSEPSVPAHHNKQSLLSFWFHATNDCAENAELIANNPEITKNIAFNYILADHDDSEVVTYNRSMLPVYYGLLRLCCQQSRLLTRQLAGHQNLQWAFKNITPHPTQYPLAVEELFKLMTLFVTKNAESSQPELDQICLFRRQTLSAYLSGLDARVSWSTLVSALRILVETDEDRLFFVSNGGLMMCFEALLTLHSMYHEATACHVSEDLQDLLREIVGLLNALRISSRDQRKRIPPNLFKGLPEIIRRLVTLLNTFNPPEMRLLTLEVLKELVRCMPNEVITILIPLLMHCHTQNPQHSMGPLGTFFPRRGTKPSTSTSLPNVWPPGSKNIPRPPRPMIQMNIPRTQVFVKGIDKEFDSAVERFYKPYHEFLDVVFRASVTNNTFNETLVNLGLLVALESVGWHFNIFANFWVGVFTNKQTNGYTELLINNALLHDYIDTILKNERMSLNDPKIANFVEIYYSKVTTRLSIARLLENICTYLVKKENLEDICGDLHAIRIIGQTGGFPTSVKNVLQQSLQGVLNKYKDEFLNEEESPPKKLKLDPVCEDELNEKMEVTETSEDTNTIKACILPPVDIEPVKMSEELVSESSCSIKEINDPASSCDAGSPHIVGELDDTVENTLTNTLSSSGAPSIINISSDTSSYMQHRAELLRDIESHIEICFECLDDEILDNVLISDDKSLQTKSTNSESAHQSKIYSENKPEDQKTQEPDKKQEEKSVVENEDRDPEKIKNSLDSTTPH